MSSSARHVCLLPGLALALGLAAQPGLKIGAAHSEMDAVLTLLPEDLRATATVVSYASGGREVVRSGAGQGVCELDLPGDDEFSASCYHIALEPYFRRSEELRADGLSTREARAEMAREHAAGLLVVPTGAYQIHVSSDRPAVGALPRRVTVTHMVYLPMIDSDDVGLSAERRSTGPWLHNAGTIDAHVMWSEERNFPW